MAFMLQFTPRNPSAPDPPPPLRPAPPPAGCTHWSPKRRHVLTQNHHFKCKNYHFKCKNHHFKCKSHHFNTRSHFRRAEPGTQVGHTTARQRSSEAQRSHSQRVRKPPRFSPPFVEDLYCAACAGVSGVGSVRKPLV